jgi:aryl-alcohol dehydrogenase-like predicted oxidoreductase
MNAPTREPKPTPGATRLALGTAQFGLDYGVSNVHGQVPARLIPEILDAAASAGCTTIDTAIAYGDSESRLGQAGVAAWHVVSKLPAFPADCPRLDQWVDGQVRASLQRLGIAQLDALLLHAPAQLAGPRAQELVAALERLKEGGLARKLGVSIYSATELQALPQAFPLEVVQAPFNVFDRGLQTTGWAGRLAASGVEVHLRSAFLQGLLLMEEGARPAYFDRWKPLWDRWHAWLRETGTGALQACLAHAFSQPFASRIVLGVTSPAQLGGILRALEASVPPLPHDLQCEDAGLIDPSQWKLK